MSSIHQDSDCSMLSLSEEPEAVTAATIISPELSELVNPSAGGKANPLESTYFLEESTRAPAEVTASFPPLSVETDSMQTNFSKQYSQSSGAFPTLDYSPKEQIKLSVQGSVEVSSSETESHFHESSTIQQDCGSPTKNYAAVMQEQLKVAPAKRQRWKEGDDVRQAYKKVAYEKEIAVQKSKEWESKYRTSEADKMKLKDELKKTREDKKTLEVTNKSLKKENDRLNVRVEYLSGQLDRESERAVALNESSDLISTEGSRLRARNRRPRH